jgi:hypothetical protein
MNNQLSQIGIWSAGAISFIKNNKAFVGDKVHNLSGEILYTLPVKPSVADRDGNLYAIIDLTSNGVVNKAIAKYDEAGIL